MIRIVYTSAICKKYQGACQKGSHDECTVGCKYELEKEKVPVFEGIAEHDPRATSGCDIGDGLCFNY